MVNIQIQNLRKKNAWNINKLTKIYYHVIELLGTATLVLLNNKYS